LSLVHRSNLSLIALCLALGLSGCGVTKLWGGSDQATTVRGELTLREHAATVSEPLWEVESKGSWFGRIAGVLISGKETADTATAAFEFTGDEDETAHQATSYLKERGEGVETLADLAKRVQADLKKKNDQLEKFTSVGESALSEVQSSLAKAAIPADGGDQKDLLKKADGERRAISKAAKSIKHQREVFATARELMVKRDPDLNVAKLSEQLNVLSEYGEQLDGLIARYDLLSSQE